MLVLVSHNHRFNSYVNWRSGVWWTCFMLSCHDDTGTLLLLFGAWFNICLYCCLKYSTYCMIWNDTIAVFTLQGIRSGKVPVPQMGQIQSSLNKNQIWPTILCSPRLDTYLICGHESVMRLVRLEFRMSLLCNTVTIIQHGGASAI